MSLNPAQIGLEVRSIRITSLYRDDVKLQVRLGLTDDAVRHYSKMYELGTEPALPPVDVAAVITKKSAEPVLVLVDGYHRVRALELLGRREVPATIRPLPSLEEAYWQGAQANNSHGVPLNAKERARMFKAWLRAGHHYIDGKPHDRNIRHMKSYRDIAKEFGISHSTAIKWVEKASPGLARFFAERGQGQLDRDNRSTGAPRRLDTRLSPTELVARSLANARVAYPGVESPTDRGALIEQAEEVITAMRSNTKIEVLDF